jgi:hypothetical protein
VTKKTLVLERSVTIVEGEEEEQEGEEDAEDEADDAESA